MKNLRIALPGSVFFLLQVPLAWVMVEASRDAGRIYDFLLGNNSITLVGWPTAFALRSGWTIPLLAAALAVWAVVLSLRRQRPCFAFLFATASAEILLLAFYVWGLLATVADIDFFK